MRLTLEMTLHLAHFLTGEKMVTQRKSGVGKKGILFLKYSRIFLEINRLD
jgi:hypothetical protein